MRIRLMTIGLALTVGLSSAALAQRVLRGKDAPAPLPATPDDAGAPAPAQSQTQGSKRHKKGEAVAAPADAGPVVPPSFKDDLTPAEIARAAASANALDCSAGRCEALFRKKVARREWVLHLRPSQPNPGQVAEVVADVSELLEIADPELGDKKPLEGMVPTAHVEGVSRYRMHPIEGSAGSYGFHFTPQARGTLRLQIEPGDGAPSFDVQVAIGQPQAKGVEVKPYEPRFSDPVAWTMSDLGTAWGALWSVALGTGHGDAAALEATVQRLAKAGTEEWPARAANDHKYGELSKAFADSAPHLVGVKPAALKEALSSMERQQCERCHVAYAWGLTSDVSAWPQVKIGKKEEE